MTINSEKIRDWKIFENELIKISNGKQEPEIEDESQLEIPED